MAHAARINENNVVIDVIVVPDAQEDRIQEYLSNDLGLGGTWIRTSYNNRIRKQYAGIGFIYDPEADVFIAPQPYSSWVLNDNFDWQAPKEKPIGDNWAWDEEKQEWIYVESLA